MQIQTILKRGYFHTDFCEDFLVVETIDKERQLIAVMDGCTMGKESTFASMLIGKIIRKLAKQWFYEDLYDQGRTEKLSLKECLRSLVEALRDLKNNLGLEVNELLSTVIIGMVEENKKKAEFLAIGDGLIYVDGIPYEFEQDDKPDYLGYHLSESFDAWYEQQEQFVYVSSFTDLSICTDGIFSFKNLNNKENQWTEKAIINYLLEDGANFSHEMFYKNKLNSLEQQHQHLVTDDLAIIRLKL